MIQYTLKDTKIRVGLETAFPNFDKDLQAACEDEFGDGFDYVSVTLCDSEGVFRDCNVNIDKGAICVKDVYSPYEWNNYPAVTPPQNLMMRIEGLYIKRPELKYYGALVYLKGAWHFADTSEVADNVTVERFRPWDEEAAK